ncbi:MAG: hypothetical protein JNL69_13225 [Bacteroidia bacterium]|nr:hypothetical protein [Bacteroidia bacterium]
MKKLSLVVACIGLFSIATFANNNFQEGVKKENTNKKIVKGNAVKKVTSIKKEEFKEVSKDQVKKDNVGNK